MRPMMPYYDIPSDCRECRMEEYNSRTGETRCSACDRILADNFRTINFDGRPDWCPIVVMPEELVKQWGL